MCSLLFWLFLFGIVQSYSFSNIKSLPSPSRLYNSRNASFKYTGSLRKGKLSPPRTVPFGLTKPSYVKSSRPVNSLVPQKTPHDPYYIATLSGEDMDIMREGGKIARKILDTAIASVKPGISTDVIDEIVHNECISQGVYPSPLNYKKFPKSCCISCNEVLCHGIPELGLILKEGDVVNVDITIFYKGLHLDCSESILVFEGPKSKLERFQKEVQLIRESREALLEGAKAVKVGENFNVIGRRIQRYIQERNNYAILRDFCGHGIGKDFHCFPNVLHYETSQNLGIIRPGQAFTIEPIIKLKSSNREPTLVTAYTEWPDNWTITSTDGAPSAQFEDTFLINQEGNIENLTQKLSKYFWET